MNRKNEEKSTPQQDAEELLIIGSEILNTYKDCDDSQIKAYINSVMKVLTEPDIFNRHSKQPKRCYKCDNCSAYHIA